jgi:hypothetical protein
MQQKSKQGHQTLLRCTLCELRGERGHGVQQQIIY